MYTIMFNNYSKLEIILAILWKFSFDLTFNEIYLFKMFDQINYDYINTFIGGGCDILFILLISSFKGDSYLKLVSKFFLLVNTTAAICMFQFNVIDIISFMYVILFWLIFIIVSKYFQCLLFIAEQKSTTYIIKLASNLKISKFEILLFLICFSFTIFMSYTYGGFRLFISFEDAIGFRYAFREVELPLLLSYLFSWNSQVILPFLFMIFLFKHKYIVSIMTFILGLLNYYINGLKSWLVIYFLILGVYSFYRIHKNMKNFFIFLFSLVILYSVATFTIFEYGNQSTYLLSNLFYRVFIEPAKLGYDYIEFFKNNELLYLRESALRFIAKSPYDVKISYLIGGINSVGAYVTQANNGLQGDAYANFGFMGIIIYPVIISMSYYYFSRSLLCFDKRIQYSILLIISWNEVNSPYFTWLLTGGVLIFYILLSVYRKKLLL